MNFTIKISDVPSEYQMLVLKYRSLLKTSIYFMEEFFKTLSFDDSRHVNDSINKVVGAQSMIKILFDNGTFCMPTIVIEDQEKFEHYRKQISL